MRAAQAAVPVLLATLLAASGARGDGLEECLKLAPLPDGGARLTNVCGSRLNVIYCIDDPDSTKSCAGAALPVTTLFPSAHDSIARYSGGALRAAVCVYPEAPAGWQPDRTGAYSCKKTCVMC